MLKDVTTECAYVSRWYDYIAYTNVYMHLQWLHISFYMYEPLYNKVADSEV